MTCARNLSVCLIALILTALTLAPTSDAVISDCFRAWSRCSKWSRIGTGILWKDCNDRCKHLKRRGGRCVRVKSKCPLSNTALQCQCY